MIVLLALWQIGQPLQAATFYWDVDGSTAGNNTDGTGLGGTGAWNTTSNNWWDTANLVAWPNTSVDQAVFSAAYVPGAPLLYTVTLNSGITANKLSFLRSGYTLTGGDLTLAGTTPTLHAGLGETAIINSQILGSAGLTKTGGGTVRLGNATNAYTGTTTISNGSVVIASQGALGADSSAVVISGSATRGFGGGQLVLEGGYTSGVNFSRDLSLQGLGTITDRSAALNSVRTNTVSGTITTGVLLAGTAQNTAINSASGMLTLSGTLAVGGTAGTTFTTFGVVNSVGAGSYSITGTLSGTGSINKTGAGTLILAPASASGFSGTIRISSASSVRIASGTVLGTNSGTTTNSMLDYNSDNAFFEIRSDAPTIGKNVYQRAVSPSIFVDHAVGSTVINGTATMGALAFEETETFTFNGRNGFGMTFGAAPVQGGDGNTTFTNNLSGTLTFTGAFWSNTENTAARTMTIGGTGNTLISGNFTASAAAFDHILTKSGTGTLTITSTGSTLDGAVNISAGTLAITDFRSITNNSAAINIGSTTTAATLTIGTATAATAAGLTTSKVINLAGTTGGATINASQSILSPVIFNAAFTATGAGAKTLTLGGTSASTVDNIINGAIVDSSSATSVTKTDANTWVLAGNNTYTGATTVSGGTLKIKASAASSTIIADGSVITFNSNATTLSGGGTLEFIGASNLATTETLGALTPTAGAGTIKTTATGSGSATLTFASLGTRTAGATIHYTPGASTLISFSTLPTVTNGIIAAASGGAAFQTYNGVDWAALSVSNVAQYTGYTVNAFPASGTGGANTNYSQSVNATTSGTASINTLKLIGGAGNPTITLGGILTITAKGVLFDNSSGTGTITGSQLGAASVETVIITNGSTSGNALTINSLIGSGTGSLTKSGGGTLVIGGANTFTGNTIINDGTVRLSGATATLGAITTAGNVTTLRQGATLDINAAGASNTIIIGGLNGAGTITNSGAGGTTAGTISIGSGTSTAGGTFSGILQDGSGVLNVLKNGTGTQVLSGLNTYTGVTTISSTGLLSAPTLANIGSSSSIGRGSSTSDATNAASLVFNGTTGGLNYTGTTSVSIDRLFTMSGGGQIANASGNNSALIFNKTNPVVFGTTSSQTLTLGGASTADNAIFLQLVNPSAGSLSLNKIGAGQWILGNNSNSYNGTTTITQGTLIAQDAAGLPTASGLILGATTTAGLFQSSGSFVRNVVASGSAGSGTVSWNASLTTAGAGFAASSDKLIIAMGGLATPTSLVWGANGFGVSSTTTAPLILSSATALAEVEWRNPIDLGGTNRTIQVDDNTTTFTDFATITGVISGSGGLTKTGAGTLQLFGANTYSGATAVTAASTLVVNFLGDSATAGVGTSVGTSTGANTQANAITLGNAGTTAGILQYVGTGEISDRMIRLNTTTGTTQIHADGSGPLVLTNVLNDMAAGIKTLSLRGSNTMGNMITSLLTNNGGNLAITVDGGATWILTNPGNNYAGATTVSAGALGVGDNSALGAGTLTLSSGTLFAYGGDRTIANAISQSNNTTIAFAGDYSINLASTYVWAGAANNGGITNTLASGKLLTLNGLTANSITAARTMTISGTGDTLINGNITTGTAFNVNLTHTGTGVLTLAGTASNLNAGTVTLTAGTLRLGDNEVIPDGTGKGNVVINPATGVTATLDVNGRTETINGLTANTAGTIIIDNTSSTSASLIFGANNAAVDFGSGTGAYTITDSGLGALSITKTGTASATIPVGSTLTYQGSTNVTGGSLTIASAVDGTVALNISGTGSALALTGGITQPGVITSVNAGADTTLNLLDGAGNKLSNLTALTLGGTGGSMTTLNLNVGDMNTAGDGLQTDTFTLLTGGTLSLFAGNKITFNLTDAGLNANQTYNLISVVDGGLITGSLAAGDYLLGGTPGGFTTITLNKADNLISLTTGNLITGKSYWNAGGAADNWNDIANWSPDDPVTTLVNEGKPGTASATSTPGQGTDVVFIADNITGGTAISTTLEQNFKINSLTFEASTTPSNTPTAITINPGVVTTNRLEVAPQSSADGISITTGGSPSVTIAAALKLGSHQTWNVTDAASVLTISGALFGEKNVTKTGAGKVTISSAADSTFNTGLTANFTISTGTLELTNVGALGTAANSNAANVILSSSGAFYFNAATNTVANNLTLGGGTLSAGTAAQTYSGTVNVSANSFINLRDANSATLTTTQRNITLSGVISGTGKLSLDTINTVTSGNQVTGTLTLSGNNSGWSGGLDLQRGVVSATNVNALGTGNITATAGRIIFSTAGGTTFNLAQNITLDAPGAVLELNPDASGTPVSDMTVNLTGTLTLGSSTNANMALRIVQATDNFSVINLSGPIVLGNNASISAAQGSTSRVVTIGGVISETGGARNLAINDDFGSWAQTNQTVQLAGANTFTGSISITESVLQFSTVSNNGGAASNLGQGTDGIILAGGTLSFIGGASQSTNRGITLSAASTLNNSGTGGATITYAGAITGASTSLTLTAAGVGNVGTLTGGLTQTGTSADLLVNSGTWNLSGTTNTIADDTIVTGATAVLNLNSTGVLTGAAGNTTSNGLYARTGATINLNATDPYSTSTGLEFIILGDNAVGGATFNTNTFNITTPRLDLGQATSGFTASVIGSGTITIATSINLYQGTVSAGLSGAGAVLKAFGGTVTLSGDNSGLTGTTAARVDSGTLALDYTTSNATKLRAATGLDMRGGTLTLNGNAGAATTQTVASFTMASGGANRISMTSNGFATTLNLGAITRGVNANDGTIRFELPASGAITTTTANTIFGILGGWATVRNASNAVHFAMNDGAGNIVAIAPAAQDDITLWNGQHVTDSTGYTGSRRFAAINSLRFNANAASAVTILSGGVLSIGSGGVLMTSNAATGVHAINGGTLTSAYGELVFTLDSASQGLGVSSFITGGMGVTKSGVGTLTLSGVNNYTGPTDLQSGTLIAAGGNAIGDNSIVTLADDQAATFQITASEAIGGLAGGNDTAGFLIGNVAIGTNALTIRGGGTYIGIFTGSGTIIRDSTFAGTNLNLTGNTTTEFTGNVIINGGLFQLSADTGRLSSAASFTINKGGSFLLDNNDDSSITDRISNTAAFFLNSADGTFSGETIVRGLGTRENDNATSNETIGVLTFASGASYFYGDASGTTGIAAILTDNFVRTNNATINARGRALGGSSGDRAQLRISTAGNQTAFIGTGDNANLVGGGGVAGGTSKTVSIVPWAVGEATTAALVDANMGNSLVTYVSGQGFKPLDLTNEYSTFATRAGGTDNVRESLTADLTGIAGTTVNGLVLHNNNTSAGSTVNITGSGAGQALAIRSGALLFTLNTSATGAHSLVLGGFDSGITMGGSGITDEYVIHVVNPSSAAGTAALTATIASNLTSTADLTKSGRGTLILSGSNTAGGVTKKTTVNEGVLQITDLDNIGGNSGGLVLAGGTLRLGTGFADDLSSRSISILTGGGTIDTNNADFVFTNGIGGSGAGGFTKSGSGSLTFMANATYLGTTTVENGRLILNGGGSNRLVSTAGLVIGGGANSGVLQLGNTNGASGQTVAELSSAGSGTSNAIVGGNAALSALTINQSTTTTYAGALGGVGANENSLSLVKSGVGTLTLSSATLTYTGTTTVSGGVLNITGSPATALATTGVTVAAGAALNLVNTAGQAVNLGAGTLDLGAGSGATVLGLELGSTSAYDSLNTTGAATTANTVVLNLTGLTGFGAGNYDLLTAASGLSGATYVLGTLSGALNGMTLSLTTTDTFVRLGTTASTGNIYWRGEVNNSWMGISGLTTNFTTDLAGTTNANGTPGAASTVIFSAQNAVGPSIATTLDGNFTINDLKFTTSPTGVTAVQISPGTPATSSLTIAPSASTAGIDVADNAGAITISAPLVLGAAQTWNVAGTGANGSSLTVSGGITGTGALTITSPGAGIATVTGTNTYNGVTTVSSGILRAGGTTGFSASSAHVIASGGILRLNGFNNTIGSLAGAGTVENNTSTNITLTAGGDNTTTTFSGVLQNGGTGTLGLTKTGTGGLVLSGSASTMTGVVTVNGGVLAVSGVFNNGAGTTSIGSAATTAGTLYVPTGGNYSTTTFNNGGNASGLGSLVINGGTVATTTATTTAGVTSGNAGYGGFFMSGGSFTTRRFDSGTSVVATAVSVNQITGGTWSNSEFLLLRNGRSEFTITGGQVLRSGASANIALGELGTSATMNVAGGLVDNTGRTVEFGRVASSVSFASLNLNAGTLLTSAIAATAANITGGAARVNFNGGTLKAAAASTTFLPTGLTAAYANAAFGSFTGGAVVDTNTFDITFAEALLAPTGNGVSGLTVGSAGSGYIGAPIVEITGGGGTGATGYATVDLDPLSGTYGQITGVVLTNPGVDYTGTPTVTLVGGGGTGAVINVTGIVANASGGLTKIGTGTLTLSGANTYTGGTTINVGTLALGAADVLADAGAVTINGGTFNLATFTETVGVVTLQSGSISGTTGVLTSTSAYVLQSGTVSGILGGSVGINKTTAGTVTLSGTNTFTGTVNVTAGTLAFTTSGNLGNAANGVTLNGGTLEYSGAGAADMGAGHAVTIGASGGTLSASNGTGVLTVSGGISGGSTGNLTKTGAGTVVVTGAVSLNGGAGSVTVSNGTLQAGFGTGGISALTVGATGVMSLQNSLAEVLTLGTTAGALTLNGGARLGFELGAPGTNDSLVVGTGGSAVTSGVVTLDFFNLGGLAAGTYNLISDTSGSGLAGAAYTLGAAPGGFNYVINTAGNLVSVTVSPFVPIYWRGGQNASWSTLGVAFANWSSDAGGTTDSAHTPQAGETVIFSASTAPFTSGSQISTTLDGSFTIDSLQFLNTPAGITDVIIAQGSSGALTLAPVSANGGISVGANAGAVTISAPLVASTSQTWFVDGTGTSSLAIGGGVTFTSAVNKTGAGALTLGGASSGPGAFTLTAGTLNLTSGSALGTGLLTIGAGTTLNNTSAGAFALAGNNAQAWNGSFIFAGTQSLDLGTGAVTLGNNLTLTVTANTLTVGGVIGDGASDFLLTKIGAGVLTLSGANTWSGGLTFSNGTLNLNHNSALGTGALVLGAGIVLNNTSGSAVVNAGSNTQTWNGDFTFTGSNDVNLGSGSVTLGNSVSLTVSAGTLAVGGALDDGANTFNFTKLGTGTLTLGGASTYGGSTTISTGTVNLGVNNALPSGTALTLSTGTTAATLNLQTFDLTVASLSATANTATASSIVIGTGKTLTINGSVSLNNNTDGAQTNMIMSGGGALVVNGASFTVGNNTAGTNNSSRASLNLSALSAFTATLSGAFTLQLTGDNDAAHASTLVLSNTANTVTATTFAVGASSTGALQTLTLGAGTNVFNANTFNFGTGGRDFATVSFGGGTGTLTVRNTAGTGRAAMSIGTGGATTGFAATNTINFAGHSVDLLLSTLTLGNQFRNGAATNTFTFDTGVLDATTVQVGFLPAAGGTQAAATHSSTLNLGGGTVTIGAGGLELGNSIAANTSLAKTVNATVNITGGTVTIANNTSFGAAVRLVNNSGAANVNNVSALLSITGGTVTLAGDIIKGAAVGTGTNTATVTLNGGSLNMSGKNIGSGSSQVVFNAQSGTLSNLAQFNGGAGLTKTTGGTLVLEGSNTYTGGTTISAGTLQVGSGSTTGTLGSGNITNNATLTINRSNAYSINDTISGTGQVIQAGAGTTTLGGTNSYTGKTTITAGKLSISSEANLGANPGASAADQLSLNGGTLLTTASFSIDDGNRGITVGAAGGAFETASSTTLTLTSLLSGSGAIAKEGAGTLLLSAANTNSGTITVNAGTLGGTGSVGGDVIVNGGNLAAGASAGQFTITGSLTVNPGGSILNELGGATFNAASVVRNEMNTNGNLNGLVGSVPSSWENYLNGTTQHDHILVNGSSAPVINGTVKISDFLGGYNPAYGDIFDLLDWSWTSTADNISGTPSFDFSSVTLGTGLAFNTNLFASNGIVVVVPEPSRTLFLMFGLLGLMLRRRRR